MKKVKGLISLSQSTLNCLFFVAETLFTPENTKKILKDTYTASSSAFHRIRGAMGINLQNGLIKPLLSKNALAKKQKDQIDATRKDNN